jgi:predicted peroxiredoxin
MEDGMTDVIDFQERRKKEPPSDEAVEVYMCECGSGLWRLYASSVVECVNCCGVPTLLRTVLSAEA